MDATGKLLQGLVCYENAMTELCTLAIEYEGKYITAQRFADRTVEILCAHKKMIAQVNTEKAP